MKVTIVAPRDPRKRYRFLSESLNEQKKTIVDVLAFKGSYLVFCWESILYALSGRGRQTDLIINIGLDYTSLFWFLLNKFTLRKPIIVRLGGDPISNRYAVLQKFKAEKKYLQALKSWLKDRCSQFVIKHIHYYIVVNEYLEKTLKIHSLFAKKQFIVAPQFTDIIEDSICKQKIDNEIHLLTVGNFWFTEKAEGVRDLLGYFNAIKNQEHAVFNILGAGEKLTHIQTFANKHFKQDGVFKVVFKGYVSEPLKEYKQSHIFVYNSCFDALPNVLLEAMSCGLPVLVNDYEPLKALVEKSKGGIVFQTNNQKDFLDKLHFLIHNRQTRENLGNNGLEFIKTHLSKEKIGRQLVNEIGRILVID